MLININKFLSILSEKLVKKRRCVQKGRKFTFITQDDAEQVNSIYNLLEFTCLTWVLFNTDALQN